jgi:hypothetical protein
MVSWPHYFEIVVRQKAMAEACGGEAAQLRVGRKQRWGKKGGRVRTLLKW